MPSKMLKNATVVLLHSIASSSNSASASTGTTRMPVNATIALGNRRNTSALVDMGTNIDGLSITSRGRRSVPSGNESYIQVGNQVIKIPPGGVSNLTINIVDGVPHLVPEVPFWPVHAADEGSSSAGFVGRIRNFLDELFKPK
uniref:Putative threonine/serine-rich mucin n=1 Tax=Panstrongylus lignarius TaxID=156445 RepID=A0A224Y0R8_9HEMI